MLTKVYEVYCSILRLGSQANPPKTIKPIHAEFDRCLSTSLSLITIKRKGESLQDLRGLQTATGCGQLIIAHLCTSLPSRFSPLLAMLFFQAVSIITSPSLRPLHPFLAYFLFSLFSPHVIPAHRHLSLFTIHSHPLQKRALKVQCVTCARDGFTNMPACLKQTYSSVHV